MNVLKIHRDAFYPEELERGTEKQRHEQSEIVITDYLEKKQYRIKLMKTYFINNTRIAEWNIKAPFRNNNITLKKNTTDSPCAYLSPTISVYQLGVDVSNNTARIAIKAPLWVNILRSDAVKSEEKEQQYKQAALDEIENRKPKKRLFSFILGR